MQVVRWPLRIAALLAAALVIGCAKPIPADRMAYVGDWQGENMRLAITKEGQVHYIRMNGGSRTSVDAPLQEFEGDDFIVGVGPLKTRFVVSKPPRREGNVWKMTVDGVELTRGLAAADTTA
jgi:hypothetical protein